MDNNTDIKSEPYDSNMDIRRLAADYVIFKIGELKNILLLIIY